MYCWCVLVTDWPLSSKAVYLLRDFAAELGSKCLIGCIRVDGDDEMGELPADKHAQAGYAE